MFARLKNSKERIVNEHNCNISNDFKVISELVKTPQMKDSKTKIAYIMPYSYAKTPCNRTDYSTFSMLFLDYDDNANKQDLLEMFAGYRFILHTSFSHQYEFKECEDDEWKAVEAKNKYRVILFLDDEYPVAKYMKSGHIGYNFIASKSVNGRINFKNTIFDGADLGAFKPTGFFGPCKNSRPDCLAKYDYAINDGELFNLGQYLKDLDIEKWWTVEQLCSIRPKHLVENTDAYGQNLMRKYKRTISQRCCNRGTGVHAAMCTVNAGLSNAKVSRDQRIAFMNELFQPTCKGEQDEIKNIANTFGGI